MVVLQLEKLLRAPSSSLQKRSASCGHLWRIMGSVSAHDAQNAASLVLLADLKPAGHHRPLMSVGTTMGGRGAANEVLRNGLAGELLAQHRMVQEIGLLEEAWQRISTGGAVAYGRADIHRATEEGAVETLLIGADVLREDSRVDGLPAWRAVAERVEVFSGKVVQCSLDHDTGEQLVGYGGAVALLRYAM